MKLYTQYNVNVLYMLHEALHTIQCTMYSHVHTLLVLGSERLTDKRQVASPHLCQNLGIEHDPLFISADTVHHFQTMLN